MITILIWAALQLERGPVVDLYTQKRFQEPHSGVDLAAPPQQGRPLEIVSNTLQPPDGYSYSQPSAYGIVPWATSVLEVSNTDLPVGAWQKGTVTVTKYVGVTLDFSRLLRKPTSYQVTGLTVLVRESIAEDAVSYAIFRGNRKFADIVSNPKTGLNYWFVQRGKWWRVNFIDALGD